MADTFNNWLIAYYQQQTPPFTIHTFNLEQTMVWPISSNDLDNIKQIISDDIKTKIPDYVCNVVIISVMPITKYSQIPENNQPITDLNIKDRTSVVDFFNPKPPINSGQYATVSNKIVQRSKTELAQDAVDIGDWDTAYRLMDEIEQEKQNAMDSRRRSKTHKKSQHAKEAKTMG